MTDRHLAYAVGENLAVLPLPNQLNGFHWISHSFLSLFDLGNGLFGHSSFVYGSSCPIGFLRNSVNAKWELLVRVDYAEALNKCLVDWAYFSCSRFSSRALLPDWSMDSALTVHHQLQSVQIENGLCSLSVVSFRLLVLSIASIRSNGELELGTMIMTLRSCKK